MAFFGLAHVGPQSSFLSNRKNAYTVTLFKLDEFRQAFESVQYKECCSNLTLPQLRQVVDSVFHGPAPALEQARLDAALSEAAGGPEGALDLDAFLQVIATLQAQPLEVDRDLHAHYSSFDQLRAHKLRQVRPFHGPEETQRAPATMLQEIGFDNHLAIKEKRHVKNHCAETKFKGELLKAGIYF